MIERLSSRLRALRGVADETVRTFAAAHVRYVSVAVPAGEIEIYARREDRLTVRAVRRARDEARLETAIIAWREESDGLHVALQPGAADEVRLEVEITAPPATALTLRAERGKIHVVGFRGGATAEAAVGEIEVEDVHGPLALTAGGAISVTGAAGPVRATSRTGPLAVEGRLDGACTLNAEDGPVTVALGPESQLELDVRGDSVAAGLPFSGRLTRDRLEGRLGDGSEGRLEISTGGAVHLLPARDA